MPATFREEFERWWDALIVEGDRQRNPYVPDQGLRARLDDLPEGGAEREQIYEVLLEWLASPDDLRWQPALGLLLRERVAAAPAAMRAAVSPANTKDKADFKETFLDVAAELEQALK